MTYLPADTKRFYRWKDKFWRLDKGMLVSSWAALTIYGAAKLFPAWGWGQWLTLPWPSPLSDIGFFLPGHIILAVYCYRWHRDAAKYKNPHLQTRTGHFSIDPKHGETILGNFRMYGLGNQKTKKPRQGIVDEGYSLIDVDYLDVKPCGDVEADVDLVPCEAIELPPIAYRWLLHKAVGPEEILYWGVPNAWTVEYSPGKSLVNDMKDANRNTNSRDANHQVALQTMLRSTEAAHAASNRAVRTANGQPQRQVIIPQQQQQQYAVPQQDPFDQG